MLELIIKILAIGDAYGVSERVDFAKGSHKLPMSLKEGWLQFKREQKWQ